MCAEIIAWVSKVAKVAEVTEVASPLGDSAVRFAHRFANGHLAE